MSQFQQAGRLPETGAEKLKQKYKVEIEWWRNELARNGLDILKQRLATQLGEFPAILTPYLFPHRKNVVLELGAGPLSKIGKHHPTIPIDIIPIDIAATEYSKILTHLGVEPPNPTREGDMTQLSKLFKPNSVDLVHCTNALDHCDDPVAAFREMTKVCRIGGHIYLAHNVNSGELAEYKGLHCWNLFFQENSYYVRGKTRDDVTALEDKSLEIVKVEMIRLDRHTPSFLNATVVYRKNVVE
jgi:SAM-dependent methyltransferase